MNKDLLALKIEYGKLQKLRQSITEKFEHYTKSVSVLERELDSIARQQQLLQEDYDEILKEVERQNDRLDGLEDELEECTRKISEVLSAFQEQGLTPSQVYSMEDLEQAGQFTMSQYFEG